MIKLDLHIHTAESDGELTPADLVKYTKSEGLKYIAITDHNTINGCDEAERVGEEIGLKVIPGCELHMVDYFEGKEVKNHLLAYNTDPDKIDPALYEFFEKYVLAKNNQSEKACPLAQKNPIVLSDGDLIKPTFSEH